jgi:hypothetical protein
MSTVTPGPALGDIVSADGLSQADVAFFSGLSPSTISRLRADPCWPDRIRGSSLQRLIVSVSSAGAYFPGPGTAPRPPAA